MYLFLKKEGWIHHILNPILHRHQGAMRTMKTFS